MQERMSDSEDDDNSDFEHFETDENTEFMHLHPLAGQNVALWSFAKYDSIAIFEPDRYLVNNIIEYAEKHLGFQRFQHKLRILSPGQLSPVNLKTVYSVRPGSVVMVMPEENASVNIEISQLKTKFNLPVDLSWTVRKIKTLIRRRKGIPVERQEILYSNNALENNRRLFEYRIKNDSKLYVMIQAHFDLLINVETFWGKNYRFYLDPCSTGMDIIYAVFNRAFSSNGPEDAGLHELYVPIHVLVLQYKNKIVNWDFCIAYLGIRTGEKLLLSTVVHHSNMRLSTVNVVTETGERYSVTVSPYDRWSILAFMLHGLTNIPVDLIRLYKNSKRVDFSSPMGHLEYDNLVIMNVVMTQIDRDIVFGVPLKISIGHGIIENLRISANKTVKHLKKKLEKMGVPNATLYELTIGNQKLPNSSKIMDAVFDLEIPLVLKQETFPVFAHTPDGVIYKTYLRVNQTISSFKHKIELKTGYPLRYSRLLVAGNEIRENHESVLFESGISCRNSIFFLPPQDIETFNILGNRWLEKIRISHNATASDVKAAVWNTRKVSEQSLNSILTILYWYFMPRIAESSRPYIKTKIKKRMPVARETLYDLKNQGKLQYLEKDILAKHKLRAAYSSPIPWSGHKPNKPPKVHHHIKSNNLPKFESTQFIDPNIKLESGGTGHPQIYDSPRSTVPPWMKNIQTRSQANRLTLAPVEEGPHGMVGVHPSKIRKKIKSKPPEANPLKPNHSHKMYKPRTKPNSVIPKRFRYDFQIFDYIASEDGYEDQSDSMLPQHFLPKV